MLHGTQIFEILKYTLSNVFIGLFIKFGYHKLSITI